MIHGDRLLLALDVLAFLVNARREVSMWGTRERAQRPAAPEMNPRGFAWKRTVEIMRRFSPFMAERPWDSIGMVYGHGRLSPADAPMEVFHDFLHRAKNVEEATFDAEYVIAASGGDWFVMGDATPINQPLRAFFRAIACGELTEADFREEG